jgi:spermidine synthase
VREYVETLYDDYGQRFQVDRVLFEDKTEHQHLIIFENPRFGRVMALDGVIQTTEADEFYYHEMLAHVPILAHGSARSVLIIGGGDGGMLREVCRHPGVERIVQVEIDPSVVELSRTHLPNHSAGAYDDPRLELAYADGAAWIRDARESFDVIIVDSTDPIGPGEVLFTRTFYGHCADRLTERGVVVTQNGVAFMQLDEIRGTAAAFRELFPDWGFYGAAVPTYLGGLMAFGWGAKDPALRRVDVDTLRRRAEGLELRYWTPEIHQGAFAMPAFVRRAYEDA